MPGRYLHDYSKDNIDAWYSRIVRLTRAGEFWLDVGRSVFFVLGGLLLGAMAGGILGTLVSNFWPAGFWAGAIAGALLGGLAGGMLARRVFFSEPRQPAAEEGPDGQEAVFAPHMPGVQEQFARARKREFALFLALLACGVFLAYLYRAGPGWPVPGFLPRSQLIWAALAVFAGMFAMLVLNARCPACGNRIGGLMKLRRCPVCGVSFRD